MRCRLALPWPLVDPHHLHRSRSVGVTGGCYFKRRSHRSASIHSTQRVSCAAAHSSNFVKNFIYSHFVVNEPHLVAVFGNNKTRETHVLIAIKKHAPIRSVLKTRSRPLAAKTNRVAVATAHKPKAVSQLFNLTCTHNRAIRRSILGVCSQHLVTPVVDTGGHYFFFFLAGFFSEAKKEFTLSAIMAAPSRTL